MFLVELHGRQFLAKKIPKGAFIIIIFFGAKYSHPVSWTSTRSIFSRTPR